MESVQERAPQSNRKAIVLLAVLMVITLLGAFMPASWVGMKGDNDSLSLTSVSTLDLTPRDDKTGEPFTWKQLAENAFSDDPQTLAELSSTPVDKDVIAQLNDENNLTASLSKDLFLASAYLKENNITDEETHTQVISQLVEEKVATIVPTKYTIKDLKVASSESKESVKAYGNALGAMFSGIITEKSLNAGISGVYDYMVTQNPSMIAPLKQDHAKVSGMVQKMLALSVPPSATIYHLSAVNNLAQYRDMLYNMSKVDTDPLRTNAALASYPDIVLTAIGTFDDLGKYFIIKNIVYAAKDSGYMFTAGYTIK